MRMHHVVQLGSLVVSFSFAGCASAKAKPVGTQAVAERAPAAVALGEVVTEISNSCWVVFQDKDNNHWFGSDGEGVFRYDGKTITRFTTKDGLAHDQIRGIDQHELTGHVLITTNGGVSRFDGERLVTLPITEMEPPALPLTHDSLTRAGWLLHGTDVWMSGAGGPRRYDGRGLLQLKFSSAAHEEEWRADHPVMRSDPYDVWTVYTDRRGEKWFGTGGMGVCRFDGRSLDWMYESHLTEVPGAGWFGFRSIIEDKRGDFWICNTTFGFDMQPHGTPGQKPGLLTYQRKEGMDLSALDTTDTSLYFQSIKEDRNGDLWMTPYMGGVWKWDGTTMKHFPLTHGEEQIKIISIYVDRRGDIWLATQERGPFKFNGTAFVRFQ